MISGFFVRIIGIFVILVFFVTWFAAAIYCLLSAKLLEFFVFLAFFVLWFAVALYRWGSAARRMKKGSHMYDEAEMRRRKRQLIISSVVLGIVALPVLVLIVILMLIEFRIIPFN